MSRLLAGWVGIAAFAFLPSLAVGAPGELDPNFSGNGKVSTSLGVGDFGHGVAIQPNGKIVVGAASGGKFTLLRYTATGELDSTFGGDGKVRTSMNRCHCAFLRDIALQPDGKIVAVGETQKMKLWGRASSSFVVIRYMHDGKLDQSFGDGGKVIMNLDRGYEEAEALVIQSNGKIVVAGTAANPRRVALLRYEPDGTLDQAFGDDGKAFVDLGPEYWDEADDLALQPDGKLVAVGSALVRVTRSGKLDRSFGAEGVVEFESAYFAYGAAIQPDGKIVTADAADALGLSRYNADGSLDSTFDGDGHVVTLLGPPEEADVAIQEDGRIIAAGGSSAFELTRYEPDGSLDSTFGVHGIVSTDFPGGEAWIDDLALQPNGKIVAVGTNGMWGGDETDEWHDVAVARYRGG